jgi:quinol monooxygenase YgiN
LLRTPIKDEKDEHTMIIIHASLRINPAKNEEFLQEVEGLLAASRAEEGNVSYDLFQEAGKEHSYMMVEVWKSPEAVDIHNKSSHFQAFGAKAKEFLAAPLGLNVFNGEQVKTAGH